MPVVVECAGTVRFFGPRLGFQTIVLHSLLWTSPVFKHLLCVSSPNNTSQSLWNHKKVKTLFLFFLTQGLDKFTDIIDHHLSTDHMIRVDILTYHVLACILLEFLLFLSEGYHGASVQYWHRLLCRWYQSVTYFVQWKYGQMILSSNRQHI